MNKKALQWLYQELPDLVNKGVVSSETAKKIKEHYGQVKVQDKRWMFLIICGVIGALLIGLGIIMLIAHNWDMLSRATRAFLSILPLVAGQLLAIWVMLKKPNSDAFKEGSAIFLSLMVGASIALISQTYNISGDTQDFILTWMLLIAPLIYLMQASIPAAIYLIGITCWAGSFWWNDPGKALFYWPLLFVALPHFIWSLKIKTYSLRSTILSFVMVVSICYGAAFSLGKNWPGGWIIINSSIFTIFYLLGNLSLNKITTNWQRPLRFIGGAGIVVLALIFTFNDMWRYLSSVSEYSRVKNPSSAVFFDYIITTGIISGAIILLLDAYRKKDTLKTMLGVFPILAILGYAINLNTGILSPLIFNLYLFALSLFCIINGVHDNKLGRVNIGMLILAVLIIVRFFDSDISFIVKGLVFIFIGIGFLATNAVLVRRRGGSK
ncbi:DUF2157 domain-containing protein [bacterium]|nr:MAG: DUF2157 domain-containing protein [bacterium]